MRRLVAWTVLLVVSIIALVAAGHGALAAPPLNAGITAWAARRDAPTVFMSAARLVTLGLGWYLIGTTVAGALSRLSGLHGVVRLTDAFTVPAVRRLLSTSVSVILMTGPSLPSGPLLRRAGPAPQLSRLPAPRPTVAHAFVVPLPPRPEPAPAPTPGPDTWTVRPGDSFWLIAKKLTEDRTGRAVTDDEIVPAWRALIRQNVARLADPDDTDLIFSGQKLIVPAEFG